MVDEKLLAKVFRAAADGYDRFPNGTTMARSDAASIVATARAFRAIADVLDQFAKAETEMQQGRPHMNNHDRLIGEYFTKHPGATYREAFVNTSEAAWAAHMDKQKAGQGV